ncbi:MULTISPECIES: DUF1833 family protein [Enterobacterales]|uniref:DUF1833 family protein n=1 Tax=Enterobacterales TaxID=91347 RepID=UPI002EDA31E1
MPVSDAQREFWSTKNPAADYDVVVISHPAFDGPIRLVANVYEDITINGAVYTACAMEIDKPEQGRDPISSATIKFSRINVGDQFKVYIRSLDGYDWMTPVSVLLQHYTEQNTTTPDQSWGLFVGEEGVRVTPDYVTLQATDDNPMTMNSSIIYDIDRYPGLQYL